MKGLGVQHGGMVTIGFRFRVKASGLGDVGVSGNRLDGLSEGYFRGIRGGQRSPKRLYSDYLSEARTSFLSRTGM